MTTPELQEFGLELQAFLQTKTAYDILDRSSAAGSTWQAGGCWILAAAMQALPFIKGQAIAVTDRGIVQHVVFKTQGLYLDADGLHDKEQLMNKMRQQENLQKPGLEAFDAEFALRSGLVPDPRAALRLARTIFNTLTRRP